MIPESADSQPEFDSPPEKEREPLDAGRAWLLSTILLIHVLLVIYAAAVQAPLVDEPKHLIAGAAHRQLGRFDIYPVNPPFARTIASVAIECFGTSVDWSQFNPDPMLFSEASIACEFVEAHGTTARKVFRVARWLCLPFTIAGAIVCYLWGRDLFGPRAGLISAACWCFCPNMLGYAGVILPDLPAASMAIAASWNYWHWLRRPTWKTFLSTAIILGLAFLTKTTLIILPVVWCAAWLAHRLSFEGDSRSRARPSAYELLGLFVVALYVLNLGYAFEGTGIRLKDYEFVSPTLSGRAETAPSVIDRGNRFRGTWLGAVPLPVPRSFVTGIDLQKRDFDLGMDSYLRGTWTEYGWWYYYLYALLVKIPLPLMLLATIALLQGGPKAFGVRYGTTSMTCVLLVGTPLAILTLASSQTGFSHHLRYILPAFPFVFVALGSADTWWRRSRACRTMLVIVLAWLAFEGASTCPHGVSYFNELVGGPRNGHRHLLHSNCDWGQDLYHLGAWVNDHPHARPILIDYYGLTAADAYGGLDNAGVRLEIPGGSRFEAFCRSKETFWLALSVTRLTQGNACYRRLDYRNPSARVGNSILVFEITPASAASLCYQPRGEL